MRLVLFLQLLLSLNVRYYDCTGCVTSDIYSCSPHIEDSVHSCHQSDTVHRKTYGGEDHGQHDHTGSWNTSGSDGCKGSCKDDCQHLRKSKVDAIAGCDEYSAYSLIDCCSVHVDCCAKRKDKG